MGWVRFDVPQKARAEKFIVRPVTWNCGKIECCIRRDGRVEKFSVLLVCISTHGIELWEIECWENPMKKL